MSEGYTFRQSHTIIPGEDHTVFSPFNLCTAIDVEEATSYFLTMVKIVQRIYPNKTEEMAVWRKNF